MKDCRGRKKVDSSIPILLDSSQKVNFHKSYNYFEDEKHIGFRGYYFSPNKFVVDVEVFRVKGTKNEIILDSVFNTNYDDNYDNNLSWLFHHIDSELFSLQKGQIKLYCSCPCNLEPFEFKDFYEIVPKCDKYTFKVSQSIHSIGVNSMQDNQYFQSAYYLYLDSNYLLIFKTSSLKNTLSKNKQNALIKTLCEKNKILFQE
jgi:hypothetical protein